MTQHTTTNLSRPDESSKLRSTIASVKVLACHGTPIPMRPHILTTTNLVSLVKEQKNRPIRADFTAWLNPTRLAGFLVAGPGIYRA
jgi:hypothetical protein